MQVRQKIRRISATDARDRQHKYSLLQVNNAHIKRPGSTLVTNQISAMNELVPLLLLLPPPLPNAQRSSVSTQMKSLPRLVDV
jgi:hypothetical protein